MRDERGATAVEVGLLALPFFTIIGAILETALIFLSGQILDSAVQDTSRFIRTGQMQAAKYDIEQFRTNMCGRLYGLFKCADLHIEVQVLNSFNAVNIKAPVNPSCTSTDKEVCPDWSRTESWQPGQGSSVIAVQVYYRWPIMLNFGGLSLANMPNNIRIMGAAAVFRNEPFAGG
ncbi:MAG: pilus assembly protein [Candidatus Devosia phytovorans]|uniref:Pilus assembly protein n=1 Tax=Candidatus Devosia phytovorans TaxID=3121372 RepID=A0AAJ5VU00_9HYPH|nr:TadE/TadG family type IV pilus assembly protein [Devosia sp.]WEK03572.1 MAG: pilus assembly protein [Devosia sp.]